MQLNFDARNVEPAAALDPIPAGWYTAQITTSDIKPTSNGAGAYLELVLEVLEGPFAKRKLYDRLNLQNNNQTAVEIAYRTLSAICHATGVIVVQDSQQLHGKPLQVKVSLRAAGPGSDGKNYDASNEIKGYKAMEGASAIGAQAAPAWMGAPTMTSVAAQAAPAVAPVFTPPVQQLAAPPWQQSAPAAAVPAQSTTSAQSPGAASAPSAAPPWQTAPTQTAPSTAPPWATK